MSNLQDTAGYMTETSDTLIPAAQVRPFLTALSHSLDIVRAGDGKLPLGVPGQLQIHYGLLGAEPNLQALKALVG